MENYIMHFMLNIQILYLFLIISELRTSGSFNTDENPFSPYCDRDKKYLLISCMDFRMKHFFLGSFLLIFFCNFCLRNIDLKIQENL